LTGGLTQQFTASVTGTSNTAVTWTASTGSISSTGSYTAPSVASLLTATVRATSQADTSKSATATITLNPTSIPPVGGTECGVAGSWSFDAAEIAGSLVVDGSGNGLNGVLSNATAVAGRVNQALSFNGSNSVVTVSDNSRLQLNNSMTLSAWLRTTNNSRIENYLGKYDASGSEFGYILKTLPTGVVGLRV